MWAAGDANVYGVDAATGAAVWKMPSGAAAGEYASSSPAVWVQSPSAARVFVGSTAGALVALDAATGAVAWSTQLAPAIFGSPVVHTVNATLTVVAVGCDDGNVYALDAATGAVLWQFSTGDFVRGGASVYADAQGRAWLLVGSNDGNVYSLDVLTGALVWSYLTNGDVYSTPVVHVVAGVPYVYVGSYDKNVYCLNMTGGLVWRYATNDYVIASPLVVPVGAAGASVLIGGEDTYFYALDAATGALQWREGVLDPVWSTASLVQSATHGAIAVLCVLASGPPRRLTPRPVARRAAMCTRSRCSNLSFKNTSKFEPIPRA